MLVSLSDARFLRHGEMAVDLANTDPRQTAFELHEPENKAGVVIFAPALRSAWFGGKQYWVFVIGNCPTKRGGMGANLSKLFLGIKAAGKWLLYYCRALRSTSSSSTTPSSTSSALALGRVPPTRSDLLTRPDRSSRYDRSYGADGRQTAHPPPEAIANQLVTARSHFEHIVTEGLKAADEVLIVPSGLWSAVDGALRPGVAALAAHLVGAGALVKIAPSLCAALPATMSASL